MFYSFQIGFSSARVYMWHEIKECSVHFQFTSTVNHDLYKYGKLICVLMCACVAFAVSSRLILYLKLQVHNNKMFYFYRFFFRFQNREANKYNFLLIQFNHSVSRLHLIIQIDHQLTYYLQYFFFASK